VKLGGLDQRHQHRPVLGAIVVAGEQGVLASQRHRAVILPTSDGKLKFVTGGTRSMDGAFATSIDFKTSSLDA
jgi:hypothetical protein